MTKKYYKVSYAKSKDILTIAFKIEFDPHKPFEENECFSCKYYIISIITNTIVFELNCESKEIAIDYLYGLLKQKIFDSIEEIELDLEKMVYEET